MSPHLVSVLLPVYNAERYLIAAIESILRQDCPHLELIAIDDGSTDNSLAILERYRKTDDRITLVSRENRGLIATLNEGLAMARGDLIARMDADDIAYPTRLSRQVALFDQQPQLAICSTGVDRLLGRRILSGAPDPIYWQCSLRILSNFFTIFIHPTVVYNRRVIPQDVLFYDASYVHAEDFDLFRRITERFEAAMIADSLLAYRVHDESVTNKHKRPMRRTHLKIVVENLTREALVADAGVLLDIGKAVTMDTVRSAARTILALGESISAQPPETRPSYEEGALNLFYFLYQMIGDEQQPQLTHEFLNRTAKWGKIRRRERYGLRVGALAPQLSRLSIAANKRFDAIARHWQSIPASAILQHQRST
ncbi:glycosyltransferase family 2 protein [Allomesorhizobium alhagi]|uniref:glycosyltransferase family 2 protein n=1 Tax=Allomesorhizobium alhagi TaxID=475067 RepID=UPI00058C9664|nr:glycosyltransferase family A protein [Mesorhizobium alhagi]